MKRITNVMPIAILLAFTPSLANQAEAQMEKRSHRLFLLEAFVFSSPSPGKPAPDMLLKTLDGEDCCLSDYFGQPLVIVKGSYT